MTRITKQEVRRILREAVKEMRYTKEVRHWSRYNNIRGIFRMYWRERHNILRIT